MHNINILYIISREGVAPSPTPWCSSYRKGSLRVTLDYGRQLYFFLYIIYIYTYIYIQVVCIYIYVCVCVCMCLIYICMIYV